MITLKDLSLAELKIEALDVEIGLLERALGGESPCFSSFELVWVFVWGFRMLDVLTCRATVLTVR